MPAKDIIERAQEDAREGKSPSTQAGEFVPEEMHHVREGKHGARSTKEAVWFPTIDQRWLVMPRFTQPELDQAILLHKLHLELPQQPPPRIKARAPDCPQEALRL